MTRYEAIYEARRDRSRVRPVEPARVVWPGMDVSGSRFANLSAPRARREEHQTPRVDIDSDKGLGVGCRPWLKIERDEKKFEACMAIAEKIGPIDTSKRAFEILKEAVGSEDQEVFGAAYLDTHLYLRGLAETGRGEMDAVMAPVKPTLRLALQDGITGVLIFHSHPTLYSKPSDSDKQVTKAFEEACVALDLFFVDHIIVGGWKEYFSFADEGLLKDPK